MFFYLPRHNSVTAFSLRSLYAGQNHAASDLEGTSENPFPDGDTEALKGMWQAPGHTGSQSQSRD